MKKLTQNNRILNLLEMTIRSNFYLFIFFRWLVGKYLKTIIYDKDFEFIKFLHSKKYFREKKLVIDVGANDGSSYAIIRKFAPNANIFSYEPNLIHYKNLIKYKNKDKLYRCFNYGLSNKTKKKNLHIPYFKDYQLSQYASLHKSIMIKRLKETLFIDRIISKIKIKKKITNYKKLDDLNLKVNFIKADIEGGELDFILGSTKTIKKYKPILMLEFNLESFLTIKNKLIGYDYKVYEFKDKKLKKFTAKKNIIHHNIFFINKYSHITQKFTSQKSA